MQIKQWQYIKNLLIIIAIFYSVLLFGINIFYTLSPVHKVISFLPKVNFAIDINGGKQVTVLIKPFDSMDKTALDNQIPHLIEVIQKRINNLGNKEISIEKYGSDRLAFLIPHELDYNAIKRLISTSAKLSFHITDYNGVMHGIRHDKAGKAGFVILPSAVDANISYVVNQKPEILGTDIADAFPSTDGMSNVVSFVLTKDGGEKFATVTKNNIGRMMAIVLDDKVLMAPLINTPIFGGSGVITGSFNAAQARELAILLKSGSLPVKLEIIEEKQINSSINSDFMTKAVPMIAASFVVLFVLLVIRYKLPGIVSFIALFLNMTVTFTILVICGFDFSLSTIAGFVLMLGMAIDANILIYEKMKEIFHNGVTDMTVLIEHGFDGAKTAIFDANITTVIAAIALFAFGNNFMRGFAITLIIGTASSVFTAIVLTKKIIYYLTNHTNVKLVNYV